MMTIRTLFKNIWNGMVGIFAEIILALFFIFIGLAVCTIWWGIFR